MKFREYRGFAEAISEALKKLIDDEWDSGRLEKNQTSYPSTLKKRKAKKIWKTVYQSDYLPFLEKYWYILPNKKTASLSKRDDD